MYLDPLISLVHGPESDRNRSQTLPCLIQLKKLIQSGLSWKREKKKNSNKVNKKVDFRRGTLFHTCNTTFDLEYMAVDLFNLFDLFDKV